MTNEVMVRVPGSDIASRPWISAQAVRWITDQIIMTQPGAYALPHPDGGEVWVCPFGSGKSPHRIDTGPGRIEARQFVEVCAPDGTCRSYEVLIAITEAVNEHGEADVIDDAGRGVPEADGPEGPDGPAAAEA